MPKISIPVLALVCLSSCYSYKIFPKEYREYEYSGERKKAFILNPELKKELNIFTQSGIFTITNDSTGNEVVKIKLLPMKRRLSCGNPIIGSALVLGQLPVYFPDKYYYEFEETNGNQTIKRAFELDIAQRVWFWDLFAFNKRFKQKAGKALLGNYYQSAASPVMKEW